MKTIPAAVLESAAQASDDIGRIAVLADLFRLLGDANRLRIALLCLPAPMAVSDIAERLGLSLSLASHHLRLLRAMGLVQATKRGRRVLYTVTDDRVRCVLVDMVEHLGASDD